MKRQAQARYRKEMTDSEQETFISQGKQPKEVDTNRMKAMNKDREAYTIWKFDDVQPKLTI